MKHEACVPCVGIQQGRSFQHVHYSSTMIEAVGPGWGFSPDGRDLSTKPSDLGRNGCVNGQCRPSCEPMRSRWVNCAMTRGKADRSISKMQAKGKIKLKSIAETGFIFNFLFPFRISI